MVKDPLIDFEEVVVFTRSLGSIPRPVGRHSRITVSLVSYVPDGDNSDRFNPANQLKSARSATTVVWPLSSEPTEPLRDTFWPVKLVN